MAPVIVFGPTGNVGSWAARTAQEKGATVFLAMRDTSKQISGLSSEQEQSGGFERVQADLTKPDTITEAIKTSGAKRAFIYHAHTQNGMKDSIAALKSAGVEFVVFLSSYTVQGEKRDIKPNEIIPFVHAQVEINLDEIYGEENYVAVRPGNFITNLMRYRDGIVNGEVRIFGSQFTFDCITPRDMGTVAGTILAEGPREGQTKVYLYGPSLLSQGEGLQTIGKAVGKDVKITDISEEEGVQQMVSAGLPKPVVEYMVKALAKPSDDVTSLSSRAYYEDGVKNVQLYTERPAQGVAEWAEENRELFV